MKKYWVSIIIVVLLAIVTAGLLIKNSNGSFRSKNNSFAVSDTSNITKFFLADKNNNSVKVERSSNGTWVLNSKYEVNQSMVDIMLKTFLRIDVKSPVAKSTRNTIIRMMAGKSIKTEIYQRVYRINLFDWIKLFPHEKHTRTYYVGDATMDNSGTYMLMEGTEEPYVVTIPGFRGFVATRYSAMEANWRSHAIFKYRVPDIKSVSLKFNEAPEKSYRITNQNNRIFSIEPLVGGGSIQQFDTIKVVGYLSLFHELNFEKVLDEMTKSRKDSVLASVPTYEFTLVDKLGQAHTLKAWKRKADIGQLDQNGNQVEWDQERMYAMMDNSDYLVSIQYFVFNDLLAPIQWFTLLSTNEQKPD